MKYDLKQPCKNCPFRPDGERITFSCRERAEEIEESAYRNGFPCHLSAAHDDDEEFGGYYAVEGSQHCVGAAMMYLAQGDTAWPGIDNDEDLAEAWAERINWEAPHFDGVEKFLDANTNQNTGRL